MPKRDYIPDNDRALHTQMALFGTNIATYATTVGVTPAQVTAHSADTDYLLYTLDVRDLMRFGAQQHTVWKDILRRGGEVPATGAPQPPVFPTAVPAVQPGIEPRFRALASQIKKHANYNASIGEALGIEGAEHTPQAIAEAHPVLKLEVSGGHITVRWNWQGYREQVDQCEIEVDRGDTQGWRLLTIDTTPDYNDTMAFPATSTKWKYRAIYRAGDERVGQWSPEVSINIGG